MKKLASTFSVIFILSVIYWSFSDMIPSYQKNEKTSETSFSMVNALEHLKKISTKQHHVGTPEHLVVQNYIFDELKKLGLKPEIQHQVAISKKWRSATNTANIIAKIKGSENGKSLVLLSHYDSAVHSSLGASDAGSGVVTILEGVRAFLAKNQTPKNDIIIVITDAEELGLIGAKAFVDAHPLAKNVGLVLNFEARGSGGPSYMLMETNGKNSKLLAEFINANPNYPAANSLMYSIYKMLPNDTDLTVFREKGNINGFNFAFIGDHFDYHTSQDTFDRLDKETLVHQADYLMTTLQYFANANLSDLGSDVDHIYTNFPFIKLLHYPYNWNVYLLVVSYLWLFVLLFFGISLNKITIKGIIKSFTPFTFSLLICVGATFLLWKGILLIHPQYNDILHGFTYNGYVYITAFVFLNLWFLFKIYKPFYKKYSGADLTIAPLVFWLIINTLIVIYLGGAGYFIVPVLFGLLIITSSVFFDFKRNQKMALFTILSIPVIYIFAPQIKMFPVGLGLKNLFISGLFLSLIYGLLTPVFATYKSRKLLTHLMGIGALGFFIFASFTSNYSESKRKPNSIVFINDVDKGTSYWATYDVELDSYTKQFLGDNPSEGNITGTTSKSKYNTTYTYHKKTTNRAIRPLAITISKDTIIGSERLVSFNLEPQRLANKIELITSDLLTITSLKVNGISADNASKTFVVNSGTIVSYYFANSDTHVTIDLSFTTDQKPKIIFVESSFDLLTNPLFTITPRDKTMMPKPFVTNDAVITRKTIAL